MDLSKLTDKQLLDLREGRLEALPDDVLLAMREKPKEPPREKTTLTDVLQGSIPGRYFAGVEDPVLGTAQLGARAFSPEAAKSIDESLKRREESIRRGRAATGSEGFDISRTLGQMTLPILLGGKYVPKTLHGRMLYGAGVGATMGATAPVENTDNYALQKGYQIGAGGALGGLIPAGMELTRLGLRTGKHLLIEPLFDWGKRAIKGREYLHAAGPKAEEIIANLDDSAPNVFRPRINTNTPGKIEPRLNAPGHGELVPGSRPTAAELAAPAGRAEFAALQKSVSSHRPSDYLARVKEQEAARQVSLATVAKTPAQLKAAIEERAANAAANYERTHGAKIARHAPGKVSYFQKMFRPDTKAPDKGIFVDPALNKLEKRPSFKEAYGAALKIAKDQGWSPKTQPARLLHTMKVYMDGLLDAGPMNPNALNKAKAKGVQSVKSELVDWMNKNIPGYEQAREQFARDSDPINRMIVGQELQKVLSPAVSDIAEVGTQRVGPFSAAMRDATTVIKKTGQDPRFGGLKEIFKSHPEELERIQKISQDLARRAQYEEQARAGMKAGKGNIVAGQIERETGGATLPNPLHRGLMVLNAIIRRAQGKASEAIQEEMAEEMLDPQVVSEIMKKAMIPKARSEAVKKLLLSSEIPVVAGAVSTSNQASSYVHPH